MTRCARLLPLLVALLALPSPALAYVSPGAGLLAIGSQLALIAAIVLAIVGFVWYPVKRVMRRRAGGRGGSEHKEARR